MHGVQGYLKRRFSPSTRPFPRSLPPRAPLAPLFSPSGITPVPPRPRRRSDSGGWTGGASTARPGGGGARIHGFRGASGDGRVLGPGLPPKSLFSPSGITPDTTEPRPAARRRCRRTVGGGRGAGPEGNPGHGGRELGPPGGRGPAGARGRRGAARAARRRAAGVRGLRGAGRAGVPARGGGGAGAGADGVPARGADAADGEARGPRPGLGGVRAGPRGARGAARAPRRGPAAAERLRLAPDQQDPPRRLLQGPAHHAGPRAGARARPVAAGAVRRRRRRRAGLPGGGVLTRGGREPDYQHQPDHPDLPRRAERPVPRRRGAVRHHDGGECTRPPRREERGTDEKEKRRTTRSGSTPTWAPAPGSASSPRRCGAG